MIDINIDDVIDRIESGESQASIARSLGVGVATLSGRLNLPENAERSARARANSAEAWLDKGMDVLGSALDKTGTIDASAARAYAQECARRAAIRNPQYRDTNKTEITGANGGAIETVSRIELIPMSGA